MRFLKVHLFWVHAIWISKEFHLVIALSITVYLRRLVLILNGNERKTSVVCQRGRKGGFVRKEGWMVDEDGWRERWEERWSSATCLYSISDFTILPSVPCLKAKDKGFDTANILISVRCWHDSLHQHLKEYFTQKHPVQLNLNCLDSPTSLKAGLPFSEHTGQSRTAALAWGVFQKSFIQQF